MTYDGGTTITYDAIGNPLTYNGYTFTWQKGRQLASASGNGKTITYKYGADGLRTEKTVNGVTTQYTYLSGLLVSQTDGTNTLRFSYTADGIPRSVNYNGTDYYYLYNLQGDVITVYSGNGTAVVNYTYDTWGKLISVTGSLASTLGALNPFRYRGYVYDTETGFYYLTTRYYDPDTGRFLNADGYISTGQGFTGFNMFAYCLNNPVMCEDAEGERALLADCWQNETSELRQASTNWTKRMNGDLSDDEYYATVLLSKTTISEEKTEKGDEYVSKLNLQDPYVKKYLTIDVSYEYSKLLKKKLDLLNKENDASYAVPTEEHIFSELLVHHYGCIAFDKMPFLKKQYLKEYISLKEADINPLEDRNIVLIPMKVFRILYRGRY